MRRQDRGAVTITEDAAADLVLGGRAFRSVREPGTWRVRLDPWRPGDFETERASPGDAEVLERVALTLGYSNAASPRLADR